MLLLVLFSLVRFHPAGSWNGWKRTSDGITDGLLVALVHLFPLFSNSEPLFHVMNNGL
jgi:hypothetical protein